MLCGVNVIHRRTGKPRISMCYATLLFQFSGLSYKAKRLTSHEIFLLDGTGPDYGGPGGFGARLPKRGPKRERDDKVHESIIEERIQRERPCRTLFIRNIKASVMSN